MNKINRTALFNTKLKSFELVSVVTIQSDVVSDMKHFQDNKEAEDFFVSLIAEYEPDNQLTDEDIQESLDNGYYIFSELHQTICLYHSTVKL